MPQTPIGGNVINGASMVGYADGSALNLTSAAVIKATGGYLVRISIINAGTTGGAFTFNDCSTTGAAATANEIFTLAYSAASVGQIIYLDWPCANGIVLSAVPTGGTPIVSVSYL